MNRVKLSLRLPQHQVDFLRAYGHTDTEALEKALDRLRELEQNQAQLKAEPAQKKQQQLDFLREKERIKTAALEQRQRLRPARGPARVDWGEGYSGDSASKYDDDWGDNL